MRYKNQPDESLLACLLGDNKKNSNIKSYVGRIKHDLEIMLNTQAFKYRIPKAYTALSHSILSFGMPDFINMPYEKEGDYSYLIQVIESLIERFEPRLSHICVDVLNNHMGHDQVVHLRINARVVYGNAQENIALESTLDPLTRSMRVL